MGRSRAGTDRNDGLTPLTLFNVELYESAHKPTQRRLRAAMKKIDELADEENRFPNMRIADIERVIDYAKSRIGTIRSGMDIA